MNGEDVKQERSSRIILLGAGTSSSIPLLSCLMQGKYLPAGYMGINYYYSWHEGDALMFLLQIKVYFCFETSVVRLY